LLEPRERAHSLNGESFVETVRFSARAEVNAGQLGPTRPAVDVSFPRRSPEANGCGPRSLRDLAVPCVGRAKLGQADAMVPSLIEPAATTAIA
jgi:hypothetical protein